MPAGRPTKYGKEILAKAQAYLDNDGFESPVPTIAGLSLYIGVSRDTCHTWAGEEDKGQFSDIVEQILARQEQKLVDGSLLNVYNSTISKLLLSKHGYSEKSETTLQGPAGGPVEVSYVGIATDGRRQKD